MGQQNTEDLIEQIDELRSQAEQGMAHGRNALLEKKHEAEAFVRDKPYRSVAIAAGAGAVIGGAITAALLAKKGNEEN